MMSALRVLVHDVLDLRAEGETKRRDEKRFCQPDPAERTTA
jgi:hypothetical protein